MGKRGKFTAGLVAMVAAMGMVAWLVWPEREPIFHGQRLGKFLAQPLPTNSVMVSMRISVRMFSSGGSGIKERFKPGTDYTGEATGLIGVEEKYVNEEQAAITEAGAAALPVLLHQLRARDTAVGIRLSEFAGKYWPRYRPPVPAGILNLRASIGVQMLGPGASNAVPELAKICDANISEPSRCGAIYALGGIGPAASNGVPALLRAAGSTNAQVQIASLWALGMIHARPYEVVPVLVKVMQDTNGSGPASSPPMLLVQGGTWRLTRGGFNAQLQAAYALSAYGPEAKAAVEPFMPVLTHLDTGLRDRLYYYLEPISPEFAVRVVPTMTF